LPRNEVLNSHDRIAFAASREDPHLSSAEHSTAMRLEEGILRDRARCPRPCCLESFLRDISVDNTGGSERNISRGNSEPAGRVSTGTSREPFSHGPMTGAFVSMTCCRCPRRDGGFEAGKEGASAKDCMMDRKERADCVCSPRRRNNNSNHTVAYRCRGIMDDANRNVIPSHHALHARRHM
jgi:hypothetical protein